MIQKIKRLPKWYTTITATTTTTTTTTNNNINNNNKNKNTTTTTNNKSIASRAFIEPLSGAGFDIVVKLKGNNNLANAANCLILFYCDTRILIRSFKNKYWTQSYKFGTRHCTTLGRRFLILLRKLYYSLPTVHSRWNQFRYLWMRLNNEPFGTIFITSLVWRGRGSLTGQTLYHWATAAVFLHRMGTGQFLKDNINRPMCIARTGIDRCLKALFKHYLKNRRLSFLASHNALLGTARCSMC